jgi:hypothetical protein
MNELSHHGFKEHGLMLYLSPSLYIAFIKLQGDKKMGRSYAGLTAFNEGMHALQYISDEEYEVNKQKYNKPLVGTATPKTLTIQQLNEKKEFDAMSRAFSGVLSQWNLTHVDPNWRQKWIEKAKLWKDKIQSASMIADLENTDNVAAATEESS